MLQAKPAILLLALALTLTHAHAWAQQAMPPAIASAPDTAARPPQIVSTSNPETAPQPSDPSATGDTRHATPHLMRPFSTVALGVTANTLGAGVEIATPLTQTLNLRAGGNFVSYAYLFNLDGVNYDTSIHFRSGQLSLDWFPLHSSFHISPGVLYFQNTLSGKASVLPGQYFELGDSSFNSSVNDPVSGVVTVTYARKIAPAVTVGFSNMLPRNGHHFSVPFEAGVAYLGAAQMNVHLSGTACVQDQCFNSATDPATQSALRQEVQDLNSELTKYKFYPILSLGFAYRF